MTGQDQERQAPLASFEGDRRSLLPLFRLADDSDLQIQSYLDSGEIFIAGPPDSPFGHVQITRAEAPGTLEIKSIAVAAERRGQGIGGLLVGRALAHCREQAAGRLLVSTAIGDVEAIAFYLRSGFRICGFIRDAFGPERGYPEAGGVIGIPLNDAVLFDLPVGPRGSE